MNFASIIIGVVIAALFGLAVRRVLRHGSCEACGGCCGKIGCACHCHDTEKKLEEAVKNDTQINH